MVYLQDSTEHESNNIKYSCALYFPRCWLHSTHFFLLSCDDCWTDLFQWYLRHIFLTSICFISTNFIGRIDACKVFYSCECENRITRHYLCTPYASFTSEPSFHPSRVSISEANAAKRTKENWMRAKISYNFSSITNHERNDKKFVCLCPDATYKVKPYVVAESSCQNTWITDCTKMCRIDSCERVSGLSVMAFWFATQFSQQRSQQPNGHLVCAPHMLLYLWTG